MAIRGSSLIPMVIIGGLFFIFGFVTWLNGSLIPFLQIACELNPIEAFLVTMVFYIAYTITALPMSMILIRIGYKNGMMLGLIIMAIGALIFIPAAQSRLYSIFLIALFILGSGLTVLQTASNPYVVHIGPHESAAVRISIMGLLNKFAGIVAPVIFTGWVLSDISRFTEERLSSLDAVQRVIELSELSSRLVAPYAYMALVLVILAVAIKLSPLQELELDEQSDEKLEQENNKFGVLYYPQLVLGVIAIFFYVGVEVIAGDSIGLFGRELGVNHFAQLTSYTMAFMVAGYITGMIVIPRWIRQETALVLSAILGIILSVFVIAASGEKSNVWHLLFDWLPVAPIPNPIFYVALLGFANALIWPAIWPMALRGLGRHTSTGAALLIMGISGGAILPLLYGVLSETTANPKGSYWMMIPCYLFILYYALYGHKIKVWSRQNTSPAN